MEISTIGILTVALMLIGCAKKANNTTLNTVNMKQINQEQTQVIDHSNKTILARGCDPVASLEFSKVVPPLIGNASYIPITNDLDFVEKLKSKKWSVVYFAPGACRFSAAKQQIPGGSLDTQGWGLEEYREFIYELQGEDVLIVETPYESESIQLLNNALEKARETK